MLLRRHAFHDLFSEVNRLRDELNGAYLRGGMPARLAGVATFPPLNIREDEGSVYVEAELPGVEPDKFDISVTEGNQLSIQGERAMLDLPNSVWHRQERGYGTFQRMLTLPSMVNSERVDASYEAGILRIVLPKAEAAKPRKIAVKSH